MVAMSLDSIPKKLVRTFRSFAKNIVKPVGRMILSKQFERIAAIDKATQILLALKYNELHRHGEPLPSLDDVAFRAYSQNGEDGALHFIFSLIGTTNKKCVEICAADGIECNTANLIINHGWNGLLIDGDAKNVQRGNRFYRSIPETRFWPPQFAQGWITTDSVNALLHRHGMIGEIDLLSLDIDGNDYWIWEAINGIKPRAVILEYQKAWGEECVSQRYDPNFVWHNRPGPKGLSGASLAAFVKLGRKKGYRLVGSVFCLNAVFLRNGVGEDIFPEISASQVLADPKAQWAIDQRKEWEKQGPIEGWVQV
jgi:hypothetical protein